MKFVKIKAGTFTMGSPESEPNRGSGEGQKKVKVAAFELMDAPVTQKEWVKVMGSNPSYFKGDNLPVEQVSWNDCQEFIKQLNASTADNYIYRLPTETEWEYACRAGSQKAYSFGDDPKKLKDYVWYYENSDSKTHEVKKKKPNKFGLYDMHGNVWEWCQDLYDSSGSLRVFRGGGWFNLAQFVRSASRNNGTPDDRWDDVGFRLLRTKSNSSLLPSYPTSESEYNRGYRDAVDAAIKVLQKLKENK